MNVLVLVGSLRADSWNRRLATTAASHLGPDATVAAWDRLAELPHYSEDIDAPSGQPVPPAARALRRAVAEADGLLIATPEYNGSVPGALKNAIDWLSRPRGASALSGKPVAVIAASVSPRAAQWAREDLVRILRVAGATPLAQTVGVGGAPAHLAADATLPPELDAALRDLVGDLRAVLPAAA